MKIDPKLAFAFGFLTTILMLVGAGTVALPLGIPHETADVIKSWCLFLGTINSALMTAAAGWSAPMSGPLVSPPLGTPPITPPADKRQA